MNADVLSLVTTTASGQQDLVTSLRRMLAAAESGSLTEAVSMTIEDGQFVITRCVSSSMEALAYTAMMQNTFVEQLKR